MNAIIVEPKKSAAKLMDIPGSSEIKPLVCVPAIAVGVYGTLIMNL